MSTICHHAIVVTSHDEKLIKKARRKANACYLPTTNIVGPLTNGFRSFCIVPDGSKEYWPESDKCDENRDLWKQWADTQKYEDGSTSLEWVEITFGEDFSGYIAQVTDDAWIDSDIHGDLTELRTLVR